MRWGPRPRGFPSTRGQVGLAFTIGPALVGVIFAFAWYMVGLYTPEMPKPGEGLASTVGTGVDQA